MDYLRPENYPGPEKLNYHTGAYELVVPRPTESDPRVFRGNILEALNELMAAPEYHFFDFVLANGEMKDPETNFSMLKSMAKAIEVQEELINQHPEEPIFQAQLERLKLEWQGLEKVIGLFRTAPGPNLSVVWFSPPGLGLDSGESRINVFRGRLNPNGHEWRIDNSSYVATPNLKSLARLYSLLTDRRFDFEMEVGSFLTRPEVIADNKKPANLIRFTNQKDGYLPPGFGISLYDLIAFAGQTKDRLAEAVYSNHWQDFFGKKGLRLDLKQYLEAKIAEFHNRFYKANSMPSQKEEQDFVAGLFMEAVKPWLVFYLQSKHPRLSRQAIDNNLANVMRRVSGCGVSFLSAITKSSNPWISPGGSFLGLLFGPQSDLYSPAKTKRLVRKQVSDITP